MLVVDGGRALEAGRAAVAVERRNLRADFVGTVVDEIFDDARLLCGDDDRVASIAHGDCPCNCKEEEKVGGEGLVRHGCFLKMRLLPYLFVIVLPYQYQQTDSFR